MTERKESELWVTLNLPQQMDVIEILRDAGGLVSGEEVLQIDVRVRYLEASDPNRARLGLEEK